jgi:hypothetical protein
MANRMTQQDGRPLEDWTKHYVLSLTRLADDWSPLKKNDSRYEVINLADVWKYFRNEEHNRSRHVETGTVEVEFHNDSWADKFNDKKINKLLHDKKLYAMELLLQEYLNRFIIEINEWEEDDE